MARTEANTGAACGEAEAWKRVRNKLNGYTSVSGMQQDTVTMMMATGVGSFISVVVVVGTETAVDGAVVVPARLRRMR